MVQPNRLKRGAWFWAGVALPSISALFWLIVVLTIVDEPEEAATIISKAL